MEEQANCVKTSSFWSSFGSRRKQPCGDGYQTFHTEFSRLQEFLKVEEETVASSTSGGTVAKIGARRAELIDVDALCLTSAIAARRNGTAKFRRLMLLVDTDGANSTRLVTSK